MNVDSVDRWSLHVAERNGLKKKKWMSSDIVYACRGVQSNCVVVNRFAKTRRLDFTCLIRIHSRRYRQCIETSPLRDDPDRVDPLWSLFAVWHCWRRRRAHLPVANEYVCEWGNRTDQRSDRTVRDTFSYQDHVDAISVPFQRLPVCDRDIFDESSRLQHVDSRMDSPPCTATSWRLIRWLSRLAFFKEYN